MTLSVLARTGALSSGASFLSVLLTLVLAVCNMQIDMLFGEMQAV